MYPVLLVVAALALAHPFAPGVAPDTIVSIVKAESGVQTLAVHDNTSGTWYAPDTPGAATALAAAPIVAQQHNVGFGPMQVNRTNVAAVGLAMSDALDACRSMHARAENLSQTYHHALRAALSTYNTGGPIRGIANGYIAGVEAAAAVVPSIATFARAGPAHASPTHDATASAGAWNIFVEGSVIPGTVGWHC